MQCLERQVGRTRSWGNYDSGAAAVMTFEEFEKWFTLQVVGVYHMIPPRFALSVDEKATELLDVELPGKIFEHATWNFRQVFEESAEKPRSVELGREAKAAVIATMLIDDSPVPVVQVEIAA